MRSALQCVFFALIIVCDGSHADPDDDFRPTPIPFDNWHDERDGRFTTLQEIVKNDSPPSVAEVPAHYWEDALRHSVYLTLVRDKIDQLIAKGAIKSEKSNLKPVSKEEDDRDMWEKIKSAPFDRLAQTTTSPFGDISIMAKGRLMEQNDGYRFSEDETTKEKCVDEKCMQGIKALWSIKRVRQRDAVTQPGKYHYELTFSVTSQTSQKERNPHNKPVRTFTVRENTPTEPEHIDEPVSFVRRPQRAVWVHKNIVPPKHHQSRQHNQGLDRFFSSLFSDEDAYEPPKYKPQNSFVQQPFPLLSKVGNIRTFGEQRKLIPYPYKPQPYKHSRHPLPVQSPPNIQPHIDFEGMFNNPYTFPNGDYKNLPSNIIKTTRPAILPTPIMPPMPISVPKKINFSTDTIAYFNITENITKDPEFGTAYKNYNMPKPTPAKVNYFPDHVRPPVFNAPPGVFVTMDKKPFKPMPPLKLIHTSKSRPIDFRPSPQVLDVQFSDPDHFSDSAFRPITLGFTDNTTIKINIAETDTKRKLSISSKKPPKVIDNIKSQRITTTTPDIITAHSDSFEEDDPIEWANLLGAFSKTTPMASQNIKANTTETEAPTSTTTTPISTTKAMKSEVVTITTTTVTSTKRTRPPPKFTKPNKIKKHKRVTTSITTATTNTPEKSTIKIPTQDLTPQATSSATKDKFSRNNTLSTTPLTTSLNIITTVEPTTTAQPVTTAQLTITAQSITTALPRTTQQSTSKEQTTSKTIMPTTNTTTDIESPATTEAKYKNRYRQSTLMIKGTSVKHDRWNLPATEKNKHILSHKPPRRNGSNFQGYSSTTSRPSNVEQNKEVHKDHLSNSSPKANNSSNKITTEIMSLSQLQSEYENSADQYETSSDVPTANLNLKEEENDYDNLKTEDNIEHDIKDQNEFIFNITARPIAKSNEIDNDNVITTEQTIITSQQSVAKNKTRCKKKKYNTTTELTKLHSSLEPEVTTNISTTTTENSLSSGFLDELLRSFDTDTSEQTKSKPMTKVKEESEISHTDDDFVDFLDSLEDTHNHKDEKSEEIYEDDDNDSLEQSPFNNEEENLAARGSNDEYNDYQDHPYTLFELMAME